MIFFTTHTYVYIVYVLINRKFDFHEEWYLEVPRPLIQWNTSEEASTFLTNGNNPVLRAGILPT